MKQPVHNVGGISAAAAQAIQSAFSPLPAASPPFTRKRVKGRMYWYHQRKIDGRWSAHMSVRSPK
jgi:hypothetical protein